MAKLSGPLLSLGARGSIAKSIVASRWKGVNYARQHVIPANPRTTAQTLTRSVFSFASNVFKLASSDVTDVWALAASGQPKTDRNMFMGANIKALRAQSSLANMIMSDGAKGGIPPSSISVGVVSDTITVTLGAPTLPDGWAIDSAIAVAIMEQDPESGTLYNSFSATDASTPYAPAITVSGTGTWRVFGFFKFTKTDGTFAYGPQLTTTASVT